MEGSIRGAVRVLLRRGAQVRANRIHPYIVAVLCIIARIPNTVVGEAFLPYLQCGRDFAYPVRESALDELHCAFDGDRVGGEQHMNVVVHRDELVQ